LPIRLSQVNREVCASRIDQSVILSLHLTLRKIFLLRLQMPIQVSKRECKQLLGESVSDIFHRMVAAESKRFQDFLFHAAKMDQFCDLTL